MNDRNLVRGLLLMALSLAFGLGALRYQIGELSHAGPGLFPLLVSALLFVLALAQIVRSRFVAPVPLQMSLRHIGLLLLALVGFAEVSQRLDMTAGIVFMVLVAGLAAPPFSWRRNVKIALGLLAVAYAFRRLLGLNLPLF
ncbi:MAG: tripartite tricarboxylate transporter TctB family protein [Burkholderiales bacterium]|nr:tripartite tricarboxylate transporter TctB family protein [Burkholderiales bacterium]